MLRVLLGAWVGGGRLFCLGKLDWTDGRRSHFAALAPRFLECVSMIVFSVAGFESRSRPS
jgi:hypothetical protein